MRLTTLLFLCSLLFACGRTGTHSGPYFDTKAYFESEASRLKKANVLALKELSLGSKTDVVQDTDSTNWTKELSLFTDIDLNKPSYRGRFTVDSLMIDTLLTEVIYKSADDKIDLKEVKISMKKGKPYRIRIERSEENTLYRSSKVMEYNTDSGYTVEGSQDVRLADGVAYRLHLHFIY